jgi:hypothetical protein
VQPARTGEGDKIHPVFLRYLSAYTHLLFIHTSFQSYSIVRHSFYCDWLVPQSPRGGRLCGEEITKREDVGVLSSIFFKILNESLEIQNSFASG